jgi:hypothetical protein
MHKTPALLAIAVLLAISTRAATAQEAPDAIKQRVLEHARTISGNEYSFTRTARSEQNGGGGPKERVVVERFDPTKPVGERWTLVTVDGQPPDADAAKSHAKEAPKRRVGLYARVANWIGAPAEASKDAKGRLVLRYATLPKESVVVNNVDISANCSAEAVVDTSGAQPFVQQVRFTLTKPTRVKLVAKIERFDSSTTYRLQPDGVPVPTEQKSVTGGSLMGKSGTIDTTLTYSDFRRVGGR